MDHTFKCILGEEDIGQCPVCDRAAEVYRELDSNHHTYEEILAAVEKNPPRTQIPRLQLPPNLSIEEIAESLKAMRRALQAMPPVYPQPLVAAQLPPHNVMPPVAVPPAPAAPSKFNAPAVQKSSGYGSAGRSTAQALQLAQANSWDVVVPKDDELFIDIDNQEQLDQHYRAMSTFDQQIIPIREHIEQPSKSNTPGRVHIYIRLDMQTASTKGWSWNNKLAPVNRIYLQLMLCSDPVREILSQARLYAQDPHPTLFFELPGKVPSGFGNIIQHSVTFPGGVVSSAPPPPPPAMGAITIGHATGKIVLAGKPVPAPPKPYYTSKPIAAPPSPPDPGRYPHKCPKCGGPSYNSVFGGDFDCMKGCKP